MNILPNSSANRTIKVISLESFSKAFTLIELLLVIVIISTLAAVVFVSLDPANRIKDSKDARRTTDVQSILTAVQSSIIDNKGALPTGLSTSMAERQLGSDATGCAVSTGGCSVANAACLNMSTPLAKYLKEMPVDPDGTAGKTGYSIQVDSNNIVTIRACSAENTTISASR